MFNKLRNKILLALGIAAILTAASCKKGFFDTIPDNITTYDAIFTSEAKSNQWLASVYSAIPDMWDMPYGIQGTNPPWPGMSDELEIQPLWANGLPYPITQGTLTPVNGTAFNLWTNYYQAIRYASIYLQNIDKNQELINRPAGDGAILLKQYKGEARFLRAYYYFQLMKIYGPVPLMGQLPKDVTANFQIPRSTWKQCVDYVSSEIDTAMQNVADVQTLSSQTGRITKGIAMAVKSQLLLFDASPLFNGNTELSNFKNLDGTVLFNQSFDASKWQKAADAAKAVIDLNRWSLYTEGSPTTNFNDAVSSCKNLFWNGYTTEGIWTRYTTNLTSEFEVHCSPRDGGGGGWNGISVLQELVDNFRMANGKTIDDATSGYSESGFAAANASYYPQGAFNMYVGREPRFYAYVSFNGARLPTTTAYGNNFTVPVGYYNTGNSGKAGASRDWPPTGYTCRKNLYPGVSYSGTSSDPARPAMMIRLAEIYLNYAEALNEAQPGNSDILLYLNKVRQRGGLPAITSGTQDAIRKLIHNERRIELCFEGQRYFDVRRWKTAGTDDRQGGQFHGMNMDKGTSLLDPAFHVRTVDVIRSAWNQRDYFWPIPQSEMDRNKTLVQFLGY